MHDSKGHMCFQLMNMSMSGFAIPDYRTPTCEALASSESMVLAKCVSNKRIHFASVPSGCGKDKLQDIEDRGTIVHSVRTKIDQFRGLHQLGEASQSCLFHF